MDAARPQQWSSRCKLAVASISLLAAVYVRAWPAVVRHLPGWVPVGVPSLAFLPHSALTTSTCRAAKFGVSNRAASTNDLHTSPNVTSSPGAARLALSPPDCPLFRANPTKFPHHGCAQQSGGHLARFERLLSGLVPRRTQQQTGARLSRIFAHRNVVLSGDSIAYQHYVALCCEMWTHARRNVQDWYFVHNGEVHRGSAHVRTTGKKSSQCLVLHDTSVCFFNSESTIGGASLGTSDVLQLSLDAHVLGPGHIAVVNAGLHFLPDQRRARAGELAAYAWNSLPERWPLLFWRKTSSTHFAVPNGGFPGFNDSRSFVPCQAHVTQPPEEETAVLGQIPTLATEDASYHFAHLGRIKSGHVSDCSHWCNPGVPNLWNRILLDALQGCRIPKVKPPWGNMTDRANTLAVLQQTYLAALRHARPLNR